MTVAIHNAKSGAVGGVPVVVNTTHLYPATPIKVRLTSHYMIDREPGYPSRPDFTGAAVLDYPRTVVSGTVMSLLKPEADALVAAGAAVYV